MKNISSLNDIPLADLSIQMKEFGLLSDGIQRITVPLENMDIISWLAAREGGPKFYWQSRAEDLEFAAIGALHAVADKNQDSFAESFKEMQEALTGSHEDVKYVGGLCFQKAGPKEEAWSPYGAYSFFIPRFEVIRDKTGLNLACNFKSGEDIDELISQADELMALESRTLSLYVPGSEETEKADFPQKSDWLRTVAILSSRLNLSLQKVVLARKLVFRGFKNLTPFKLLASVSPFTAGCTQFLFSPQSETAFLGASPELLYLRQGRKIKSEALAGTRARGTTAASDEELSEDLLQSDKDMREHRYVRDAIQSALGELCESLTIDEQRSLVKVANCQHLSNGFSGRLKNNVSDYDILTAMHPTPAVGGSPRLEALEQISQLETFDRGWYAAPVGWISLNRAEFAVAIRSALMQKDELSFYAGAGIVEGSEPEKEWQETQEKIVHYLKALGL